MKTTKYFIFGSALLAASMISCEDKLDIEQHGVVDYTTFYEGDENCDLAITECYSEFRYLHSGSYRDPWQIKLQMADEIYSGGSAREDNPHGVAMNEFRFDASNENVAQSYEELYKLVYRANIIINKFEEGTSAIQKRNVAEAKVFRAMCYVDLVTLWGNPPLITEAERTDYKAKNTDAAEIWAQIEKDLNEAISSNALTSKKSLNDTSSTRITKEYAQALLAKVYMFEASNEWNDALSEDGSHITKGSFDPMSKYAAAEALLQTVVNSGKYELLTGTGDDYGNLSVAAYNNNKEIVFSESIAEDASHTVGFWPQCCYGWSVSTLTVTYKNSRSDIGTRSYGQMSPSQDIVNDFIKYDGVDSPRFHSTLKNYNDLLDMGIYLENGKSYYAQVGYWNWKFRAASSSQVTGSTYGYWNNKITMRYAEVLLMLAEAKIQQGKSGDVEINLVRNKAGLSPKTGATLEDLKMEKRLELYMEGVRFLDLLRWGDAEKELSEQYMEIPSVVGVGTPEFLPDGGIKHGSSTLTLNPASYTNTTATAGFKSKHHRLPYPLVELNANANMVQNAGW